MKREYDITKLAFIALVGLALLLAVSNKYRLEMPWMTFEPATDESTIKAKT
jgi:hypothetical protein